jgi:DNA-binding SARP family transcriptional activator
LDSAVGAAGSPMHERPRGGGETMGGEVAGTLLDAEQLAVSPRLFEQFVYGLAMGDGEGRIVYLNRKARQLLLPDSAEAGAAGWTCCDLICSRLGPLLGAGCMSAHVARTQTQTPEVRMDIGGERQQAAAWVTVSPLEGEHSRVLFHLRPGRAGDRRRRTGTQWRGQVCPSERGELQISCLGGLEVEGAHGPINGDWLEQRPGQLLKYLLCERRRLLNSDQIGEALWPEAGAEEGKSRLRYNVHLLRERLEPERGHRLPARFIVARGGGYVFETDGVWIDADRFEREALAGLAAAEQGLKDAAAAHLTSALGLYRGGFLAEERYVEWAVEERERLRELAGRALRAQVEIEVERGELEQAAASARRLVELDPFDCDVQKLLIEICLRRGRRSEAMRRYSFFQRRMECSFGQKPDFDLPGLLVEIGAGAPA